MPPKQRRKMLLTRGMCRCMLFTYYVCGVAVAKGVGVWEAVGFKKKKIKKSVWLSLVLSANLSFIHRFQRNILALPRTGRVQDHTNLLFS